MQVMQQLTPKERLLMYGAGLWLLLGLVLGWLLCRAGVG